MSNEKMTCFSCAACFSMGAEEGVQVYDCCPQCGCKDQRFRARVWTNGVPDNSKCMTRGCKNENEFDSREE